MKEFLTMKNMLHFKINRVAIKSAFVYTIKVRIKDVGMLSKSPDISHRKSFFYHSRILK